MGEHAPGGSLRLAELVAALSLGVDLGFGQPMEHVLRQCLIALRLAERRRARRRAALGRLLHGAAGQRRLPLRRARAGEVVRRRHRAQVAASTTTTAQRRGRGRGDAAAGRRGQPAAAPVPGRARVRRLRASRARRDDRAARGAGPRSLAEQLGLPDGGAGRPSARRTSSGTGAGWPGSLQRRRGPGRGAARPARGVRRGGAPGRRGRAPRRRWPRKRAGAQFDPTLCGAAVRRRRGDPRRPRLARRPGTR